MWRSRMFWRLFGICGVLLLGTIGLLGWVILSRVEQHYLGQTESSLHNKAVLVREALRNRPAATGGTLQSRMVALRQEIATRITLLAVDGKVLADSEEDPARMENHAARPEVQAAREKGVGTATRYSTTVNEAMMYVAVRAGGDTGEVALVRVALPLDAVGRQLAELRRIVWTAAALTAVAAFVLTFWLARLITRPLQELKEGVEKISAGGYGHRVFAAGKDEVGALARSFNDMSERLAVQLAQLDEDREQLRMILGGMVEGVIALDAGQRILFANERAGQLLEFRPGPAKGRKLWEVVRRRALQELVERALSGPQPQREELSWNGPAARCLTAHAARLQGLPPRGAVLVLHDTTELRRLERLRRDFVANVSHELKTPLSVIKACVETLIDGAVDDPEHRGPFLNQIDEQANRLHALILDLLSLARIESGEEFLEMQAVPLGPVVAACLERHRARAEAYGQTLAAISPAAGDAVAWADEEAVGQILENLVDNALKYTPAGGRIGVRWRAEENQVCLQVEDTGIGIPEQDLPRVFERFYRVDKARSRELGGTGLGLAIVKHLVQAMQGTVSAASQLGRGTVFTVCLPLSRPR
jgi:two-component system phosphate regulon sensor histidine kinase PhoR